MNKLYSNDEAAAALGVSPHTIRAWTYQRRIKPVKLGRRTLFTERELQRLIDEGQINADRQFSGKHSKRG